MVSRRATPQASGSPAAAGSDDDIRDDESLSSLTSLDGDDSDSSDANNSTAGTEAPSRLSRPKLITPRTPISDVPEPKPKIEWLATSRSKRSTAGNRMKAMLATEAEREDPTDDLELLFAEDENDAGFVFDGNDDDLHLDSSSDDEDEHAGDDLEGERELEKADKAARLAVRKRRSQAALPAKFRKKVRIQPPGEDFPDGLRTTITGTGATPRDVINQANATARLTGRSKKKSERASWLPSAGDMPVRASERKTTKISKEMLHQRMREGEERRKRHVAAMERQAKRREAMKKPPMTQIQRIAEAAEVEKRNAKSLNRWEEAEKHREEERKAKLAALNNRTLKGPVITYWSGVREWNDNMNGAHMALEEKPKRKRVTKADKDKEKEKDRIEPGSVATESAVVGTPAGIDSTTGTTVVNQSNGTMSQSTTEVVSKPVEETPSAQPKEMAASRDIDGDISLADALVNTPESETDMTVESHPAPASGAAQTPASMSTLAPVKVTAGLQLPPGFAPPNDDCAMIPPPSMTLSRNSPAPKTSSSSNGILAAPVLAPPLGAPNLLEESLTLSMGMSAPKMSACGGFLAPPAGLGLAMPLGFQKPRTGAPFTTAGAFTKSADTDSQSPATIVSTDVSFGLALPSLVPEKESMTAVSQQLAEPSREKSLDAGEITKDGQKQDDKPPAPPGPAMRTAYILQNFDENIIKDKTIQTQILFGQKMNRIAKPQAPALCVITNQPAKYRDPVTGLPYHNAYAYKQLQKLRKGEYRWSKLLGVYIGPTDVAAKGVPERFLAGKVTEKKAGDKVHVEREEQKEETEQKHGDDVKMKDAPGMAVAAPAVISTTATPIDVNAPTVPSSKQVTAPVSGSITTHVISATTPVATSTASPASSSLTSSLTTAIGASVPSLAPVSHPSTSPPVPIPVIQPSTTSTGGATVLQPPMVPLTQPHVLKPPPPAGLPIQFATVPQAPTQRVLAAPVQPVAPAPQKPLASDIRIAGMAPWGIPRPAAGASVGASTTQRPAAQRRAPTHSQTHAKAVARQQQNNLQKPAAPRPQPVVNGPVFRPAGNSVTGNGVAPSSTVKSVTNAQFMPVQRPTTTSGARTIHVSAPGQTLPPRGQAHLQNQVQAQRHTSLPVATPPTTSSLAVTAVTAPASSSLPVTPRQPLVSLPNSRPAPLAITSTTPTSSLAKLNLVQQTQPLAPSTARPVQSLPQQTKSAPVPTPAPAGVILTPAAAAAKGPSPVNGAQFRLAPVVQGPVKVVQAGNTAVNGNGKGVVNGNGVKTVDVCNGSGNGTAVTSVQSATGASVSAPANGSSSA